MNMNGVWKEAHRINQQSHALQSAVTGSRMITCNLISVWAVGEFFCFVIHCSDFGLNQPPNNLYKTCFPQQ